MWALLLSLHANPKVTFADIKRRAEAIIFAIQERVKDLQTTKRALGTLGESCSGRGPLKNVQSLIVLKPI
ncbi:MAG: hypothetical protein NPIRA04_23020 [Nitrospirales bacterium]|nr:MAG: hypothetical protein NPIRA04_23020 [Nitrospirales bacterium]